MNLFLWDVTEFENKSFRTFKNKQLRQINQLQILQLYKRMKEIIKLNITLKWTFSKISNIHS